MGPKKKYKNKKAEEFRGAITKECIQGHFGILETSIELPVKKFSDTALHTAECMTRTICLKTGAERYTNKWFDRRTLNRVKRTKPDVDELICRQKRTDYKSVTTSQPLLSALRCVPLTDSCFTFPSVLLQPETHSLSASSMQDPSALPGGGPTSPPSFRTTASTSCC